MKQPEFAQFQDNHRYPSTNQLQSSMSFTEVNGLVDVERLARKKTLPMKKNTKVFSPEQLQENKRFRTITTFQLSITLINLLRDPKIQDHEFDQKYLHLLQKSLKFTLTKEQDQNYLQHCLYLHLILCQIQNFDQLGNELNFSQKITKINHEIWNSTNSLNTFCILENFKHLAKMNETKANLEKQSTAEFKISIIEQDNICVLVEKQLKISKNFVEISMNSLGHWDIYFGPFLIDKFETDLVYRYLSIQQSDVTMYYNYSKIFIQVCNQYTASAKTITQNWYQNQLQKLINEQFSINQIEHLVYSGIKNSNLERLLIGLQGWKQESENAIKLLNCYYDLNDWRINDATKPTICQCRQNFTINYLIQNSKNRQKLVTCLKAPCFNSKYHNFCFSFHKPKLNQYTADNISYLWVQNPFGKFKKCGFYDWIFYFACSTGKQHVNKIIDIRENKKIGSQFFNRNALNMKNVKGRYIIHPPQSRQMQIHQIYLDSLNSDSGIYKTPLFSDAINEIYNLKTTGVNTVYLSGVFQRDNGEFQHGFKRPQASSTAITNRAHPSSLLGGDKGFRKLIQYSKQNKIKIIVDASTRVSSSRMSKKYQKLKLVYIDDKGRKEFFYGCEGRALNYEETAILNYRKKQAWDLFLNEILQMIEKYGIDGIHLDNGSLSPQMFKIDIQELNIIEDGRLIYTHDEIFEGQIINPKKKCGYWSSKSSTHYSNPFYVFLTTNVWKKYPYFTFICDNYENESHGKFIKSIQSGFIPRLSKLPKALSQILGIYLHENGTLTQTAKQPITKLAKWYEQTKKILPKNSIMIQSTTTHVYPYPSFIFKKATWAVIDLFFFLPEIPMTFSKEYQGRVYRTKALNYFQDNESTESKLQSVHSTQLASSASLTNSRFFGQQPEPKKKQKLSIYSNITIRDPSQIKHQEQNFRKQVGPEFGFDLNQIHKHYQHRRKLRQQLPLLTTFRMISLSSEHLYGMHTNVISFAKYNDEQILLISINFNETDIDMHYNLTSLKNLFKNAARSDLIIKIEDVLNKDKFVEEYYLIGQLLNSKIEEHIKGYSSSIWRLTVLESTEELMKLAFKCSQKRIIQRISRKPPQWIYSSIFTNELSRLIVQSKTLKPFVNGFIKLYNEFILSGNISLNLVISKTHELFVHKVKLQKLFGIFKLLQRVQNKSYFEMFEPTLRNYIENLLKGNQLGPIAFITPEIGAWSSVGGLGVMVDELSKQLVKLGQTVYIITPYYEYNKKKETGYLKKDGFAYEKNIKVYAAHFEYDFGIHRGKYQGVNYIWFHNSDLFSRPYQGQGALFVTKQMVFFALICLESFCQLQIFPSIIVTNDWMCGFVSAYVKVQKYKQVFNGSKFIHICHNLDSLYEGRLYPKYEQGDFNWLIQLPREWYLEYRNNKAIINPSRCALETCDNWGTVSHSYKIDLLKESPLAEVLWKHPHPFSFPNGVRKDERLSIIHSKTPGNHIQCKKLLQQKYFNFQNINDQIPLFAFIGRVTRQKGVQLIIDAIESLLQENSFKIQFLIGGPSDSKQQYGKYCAQRMRYLTYKYPQCVWSNPDAFFTDGSLVNVGSDYAMMPSLFEPGGIVQHEFFCGHTPVIAFRTGGLKDTVFEYDIKAKKGNGFNFMSYDVEDFKRCMRRAIACYKNKQAYLKLRQNAFESVVEQEDVARGWNSEFYRMQNKIYIDWDRVEKEIKSFTQSQENETNNNQIQVLIYEKGQYWKKSEEIKNGFKQVLKGASRLEVKSHLFIFQTQKIPRPKQIMVSGTWDNWSNPTKMNFERIHKNWKISLKLKPGTYYYKYIADGEWILTKDEEIQTDENNISNHIIVIE